MTAHGMRSTNLKMWNRTQVALLRSLRIPLDPALVSAFGQWFFQETDRLHRFPGPGEARRALAQLYGSCPDGR